MDNLILRALIQAVIVAGAVALAARRLGYSSFLWFFAQLFGGWFTLGMLSALPDRRLEKRRNEELAILRKELVAAKRLHIADVPVPEGTLGNLQTLRS